MADLVIIICILMTTITFRYLFLDAWKMSKHQALEAIPFIFMISLIWVIYWGWFIWDQIKEGQDNG